MMAQDSKPALSSDARFAYLVDFFSLISEAQILGLQMKSGISWDMLNEVQCQF